MPRRRQPDDDRFMAEAVALAERGIGATDPNPSVGAVVVRDGRVVGRGRTGPAGTAHAEVRALRRAGAAARGATLYVTLEPCAHHGRTPPCTEAIEAAGIARVVVGIVDPSPRVAGRGIRRLRRRGIAVTVGVLRSACRRVHGFYLHHERTGRPFVTLKLAASIDGRIAAAGGDSRWITGPAARRHAHGERARHHAIAVGVGTALADDPALTVRHVRGVDPIPVVFDTALRCAGASLRVLRPGAFVLHGPAAPAVRRRRLRRRGVVPLEVPAGASGVDPLAALEALGALGIRSLLVEGGGRLAGSLVQAGLVDRLLVYRAPVVLGEGTASVAGFAVDRVAAAPRFRLAERIVLGDDVLEVYHGAPEGGRGGAA